MKMITDRLVRQEESASHFYPVVAGRYRMSIQGSDQHYSTPKRILSPSAYTRMEVQLQHRDGRPLAIRMSSTLRGFPQWDYLKRFIDPTPRESVLGWVPVTLIDELYTYLRNL